MALFELHKELSFTDLMRMRQHTQDNHWKKKKKKKISYNLSHLTSCSATPKPKSQTHKCV